MEKTINLVFNGMKRIASGNSGANYPEKFGIYVLCPFSVPYYVGKSEGLIVNRIQKEHLGSKGIISQDTTYTIFELDFYKDAKTRIGWLKRVADPSKLFNYPSGESFSSPILYLNNQEFFRKNLIEEDFKKLIPVSNKRDDKKWALNKFPNREAANKVQELVFRNNTQLYAFWAEMKANFLPSHFERKKLLECCETAVKFCLRANTISKSDDLDSMAAKLELLEIKKVSIEIQNPKLRELFYNFPYNENGRVDYLKELITVYPFNV